MALTYNICYTFALYALLIFYMAAKDLLEPHKPLLKFVVVKCVVFFTFWQSIACSLLVNAGLLYDGEEARATQNFLISVEMVIAMLGMVVAFPHSIYTKGPTDTMRNNIRHAISIMDVWTDLKLSIASRYVTYVLYADDTEAAPKCVVVVSSPQPLCGSLFAGAGPSVPAAPRSACCLRFRSCGRWAFRLSGGRQSAAHSERSGIKSSAQSADSCRSPLSSLFPSASPYPQGQLPGAPEAGSGDPAARGGRRRGRGRRHQHRLGAGDAGH